MVAHNNCCKLPIAEEKRCFLSLANQSAGSSAEKLNNDKMNKVHFSKINLSIFAFISVLIVILLLSVIYLLFEINQLKRDVHHYMAVPCETLSKDLNELRQDYQLSQTADDEKPVKMSLDDYIQYNDESGDYNYDYDESGTIDDAEDTIANNDDDYYVNLLTGGDFTKDIKDKPREKRNIIGYTDDGVAINSESYAEAKQKNQTNKKQIQDGEHNPQIEFSAVNGIQDSRSTSTPRPISHRKSRVLMPDDKSRAFRQFVRKSSLKSGDLTDSQEESEVQFKIVPGRVRHHGRQIETLDEPQTTTPHRPSRMGRMRPLPTAHFHGDTSKYVLGVHENFNGDGHLRHPQKTYVDWSESSWFRTLGMDRHFDFDDGKLTIKDSGLYFVYAQIYYYDEHDINGFMVYKNDKILLQCTTMTHSMKRVMKGNTCYTAAAEYLQEGDRITLGDISDARYSMFEPGKSFFGVIKLGDVKIK